MLTEDKVILSTSDRFSRFLFATLPLALCSAISVRAADTGMFERQVLTLQTSVINVFPFQFDGTAWREVATTVRNGSTRELIVFRQALTSSYDAYPALTFSLPADVFGVEVVDLDKDGREELLLIGLEACYLLDFNNGGYGAALQEIARYDRLFSIPNPDFVSRYHFAFDLSGDGQYELLVPCWNGLRVLQRQDQKFAVIHTLNAEYGSTGGFQCQCDATDFVCRLRHSNAGNSCL